MLGDWQISRIFVFVFFVCLIKIKLCGCHNSCTTQSLQCMWCFSVYLGKETTAARVALPNLPVCVVWLVFNQLWCSGGCLVILYLYHDSGPFLITTHLADCPARQTTSTSPPPSTPHITAAKTSVRTCMLLHTWRLLFLCRDRCLWQVSHVLVSRPGEWLFNQSSKIYLAQIHNIVLSASHCHK